MKAFSERNPIAVAVVGLTALVAVVVAGLNADHLPLVGSGDTYAANFRDAGGLKSGDDVRVAGVKVGEVEDIDLVRRHVRVEFTVKDAWLGDRSTAAIRIKTLLGEEYVALDPQGSHALAEATPIPVARTTTPLDVSAALSGLARTTGGIDTAQLARGFDTLSSAFQNTPRSVHTALTGLSRLSKTIASRDEQLRRLAANASEVTGSLARSDRNIAALIGDGSLLLQELRQRSQAISGLLTGTRDLARQLSGFVRDNQAALAPALAQLSKVTTILTGNKRNLDAALRAIGPYYSMLTDATGSGRWVDVYLCGLFTKSGAPILDANAKRNCRPGTGS
ncbi:phospholipid/cholesterol/gamma-HCH transport system substrate-binding protein [Jatrophihabitans endophyticus]|uniref:Phospholipid/cholesterol/gamma-HCH transport system substrate-binding protein n=1 Tax=Jatrophihabitans endophyticus TaxID=1206085 RepID=A0A1M5ET78_9ACTN|nr:MCE family protein [Jatrophihabitans endophyticus]SHF82346.1 phospholipid/cholesterol/gamma-HCH transport system substrate-binding protein [Jatrophihabitans endophyticus]